MASFMKKIAEQKKVSQNILEERIKGQEIIYAGDPALAWATGGINRSKCNLIYGVSGSGKTALALKWAGEEQKITNGYVLIFDSEYAHSDTEEKSLARYRLAGIDTDKLIVISSNEVNTLFGRLGELEADIKSGELNISTMIVDSWGGVQGETARKKIDEGEISAAGNQYGGNAKVMAPILQQLLRISAENGVTSFFIQHCIDNLSEYGPRKVLIGGQKLRFLVHGILYVESVSAKDGSLLEGDVASENNDFAYRIGKKIRFRCEKSRNVVEGRKGEFWMDFSTLRFARPGDSLFNLATNLGVIGHPKTQELDAKGEIKLDKEGKPVYKESKNWWCFPADVANPAKFNGSKQTIEALESNKQLFDEVFAACTASKNNDALGGVKLDDVADTEDFVAVVKKGKKK
jgi:RecA/RadA recombinase